MQTAKPSRAPREPELHLRPYSAARDADRFKDDRKKPALVLEFVPLRGDRQAFGVHVGPGELAHFYHDTVEALGAAKHRSVQFAPRGEDLRTRDLRDIALATRGFLEKAIDAAELTALGELLGSLDVGSVLRVSDDGMDTEGFPWPALHVDPVPNAKNLKVEGFLAGRFALVGSLLSPSETTAIGGDEDPWDPLEQPRTYGFVDDPGLVSVRMRLERDHLEASASVFDPLHPLPPRSPPDPTEPPPDPAIEPPLELTGSLPSVAHLADYLVETSREAVHFACHGGRGKGRASARYAFQVRRQHAVDSEDLELEINGRATGQLTADGRVGAKVIFLNMCGSQGDKAPNAVRAMGWLGPRTLIGTIGNVCERSAAELAIAFYAKTIGTGAQVGQAFGAAIREALETTRNPTHLLFMMQGDPYVRLK